MEGSPTNTTSDPHSSADPSEGAYTDWSDSALVARAQESDVEAFAELFRRYRQKIYGLIYNMTSNKEDAEDLLQEVFVKAYSALNKFQGKSSFYTWIYRIAVNRTINYMKKRNRRTMVSLHDLSPSVEQDPAFLRLSQRDSPVRNADLADLSEELNKALQKLSEKHRSVVVMHDIQGMPHDEIAEVLKCSKGTVRSRLFYARKRLQRLLAEFEP